MKEDWGPWIEHDGGKCPVPDGVICHRVLNRPAWGSDVRVHGKTEDISPVERGWEWKSWEWVPGYAHIIRYRIRKPRALEQLREIAANPELTRELEDA